MPAKQLRIIVQGGLFKNVAELASAFNISQAAMVYRMQSLGMIP